jgi:hypothetical protein
MIWTDSVANVVNTQEMANEKVEWLGLVFKQREEVPDNTFVDGVKVLNVEGVVWEGHIRFEGIGKDRHPGVIAHECQLT